MLTALIILQLLFETGSLPESKNRSTRFSSFYAHHSYSTRVRAVKYVRDLLLGGCWIQILVLMILQQKRSHTEPPLHRSTPSFEA